MDEREKNRGCLIHMFERKRMTSRYFKDIVQLVYLNNSDPKQTTNF